MKDKKESNVLVGFPEYRMTNASNFSWGFPPASNPQRVTKGAVIYGNEA